MLYISSDSFPEFSNLLIKKVCFFKSLALFHGDLIYYCKVTGFYYTFVSAIRVYSTILYDS